jgi:hypothetical protein
LLKTAVIVCVKVVKALGPLQESLHREINPVVMSATRFIDQLAQHERFAQRLCDEPKIFIIGDEDEFGKLVEDRAA